MSEGTWAVRDALPYSEGMAKQNGLLLGFNGEDIHSFKFCRGFYHKLRVFNVIY